MMNGEQPIENDQVCAAERRPLPDSLPVAADLASPVVRRLGLAPYGRTWEAMQRFTAERGDTTPDELWLLEHPPVYTLGLAARRQHLREPNEIPVVQVDRGGQVTYHGPGQAVIYTLLDLRRRRIGVRDLVRRLEGAVIDLLDRYGVMGVRREGAPGIYVGDAKIAALGLRVRNGCCYHGLALNVDMDLGPFRGIDPCGYAGLPVTQLRDLGVTLPVERVGEELLGLVQRRRVCTPEAAADPIAVFVPLGSTAEKQVISAF
jgi:lipoyl(octanoyl) transferase